MKVEKKKVLVSIPVELLATIDKLAKKAGTNRAAFICNAVEQKLFADACRETIK